MVKKRLFVGVTKVLQEYYIVHSNFSSHSGTFPVPISPCTDSNTSQCGVTMMQMQRGIFRTKRSSGVEWREEHFACSSADL